MNAVMIRAIPKSTNHAGPGPVRSSARPRGISDKSTKYFPPFRLDVANQCLWRTPYDAAHVAEEERILLTPKAFAVLHYLVENAGRLVSQDELLDAVWPDTFVQPEVLKYQIADIRGALGDSAKNSQFIETSPRRGYRFIAPVKEAPLKNADASFAPASSFDRSSLVGRDRELRSLHDCLRRILRGQRQIVFVTGEPGIGKTALVDEFLRQAAAAEPNLRIARGQCVEGYGGAEAYYPVLEAIGQLCRTSGKPVVDILAAHAPSWLVQFPALLNREQRQMLEREISGGTRVRMLREISEALDTFASESPLLLVLDDLQWVDTSTVDLISAIARRRTAAKLMMVVTKRPVDMAGAEHPLRALRQDLLVHHLCEEISLPPLSQAEIAGYLTAQAPGGSLPAGFAELVHGHSGGNPLFTATMLDHMSRRSVISRESGRWQFLVPPDEIALEVPDALRRIIEAQIDRLTIEEQRALEIASVVGPRFCSPVVASTMKVATDFVEEVFERLARRCRLLRWAGCEQRTCGGVSNIYEFPHMLYREVLYRRQPPTQRSAFSKTVGKFHQEMTAACEEQLAVVAA